MSTKRFIGAVEDEWQLYSDDAADYELGLPVGFGASSTVYQALYKPSQTYCAVKVVDLDKLPQHALHLLKRETQLMSLSKHPNVLRVRGSWTDQHKLSIAFRLMNAGSAADVMRYAWPGGMDEDVVKCILKQALEGLQCVVFPTRVMAHSPRRRSPLILRYIYPPQLLAHQRFHPP
jgi:serine/threonine-protein kinase OSR1/STK39